MSTLRKWYANSKANGEAGISNEGVAILQNLVQESSDSGKDFYCSLSFDEMSIQRNVQYCDLQKKNSGFITYGIENEDHLPVARMAIVFMITDIISGKSFPIAHHFIKSLKSKPKSELIKSMIVAITQANAVLLNITCDGPRTNFSAFEHLGASFDTKNLRPYIQNPINGSKIHISFDACHMLKLVRNCIGDEKEIVFDEKEVIKWCYFEELERYRCKNDFITHKVNKAHIEFSRAKMKVSLAAELLSKSVAKSMRYLMEFGQPGFQNCSATAEFISKINDLFDVLNTGTNDTMENNNNVFKIPLSLETGPTILPFLDECLEYMKKLELSGTNILHSRRKTGFLGFMINIVSLKAIYTDYVVTGKLDRIPTFNLSQDVLESFFGRIRSMCGYNDNPTVEQFKSAYRKTLINDQISSSTGSNCVDKLSIYSTKSTRVAPLVLNADDDNVSYGDINGFSTNDYLLDACEDATICALAARIEDTIRTKGVFHCSLCLNVFNENSKICENIMLNQAPCISTVHICKVAYKYLNIFKDHLNFNYERLLEIILFEVNLDICFVVTDFSQHESHKNYFVTCIAAEFL